MNPEFKLSTAIGILPAVTLIIVLLGIYNIDRYYDYYDIEIFTFLDTAEVLLSFTDLFSFIVKLVLIFITFSIIIYPIIDLIAAKRTRKEVERIFTD